MKRMSAAVMAALALTTLAIMSGCGGHRAPAVQPVWVAPAIDLKQYELIGIVEFSTTSKGHLGPLATRRFTEAARRDQGVVRIVDVRPAAEVARSGAPNRWTPETFKAIGRDAGVKTLMTGQLTISSVKPNLQMSAFLNSGHVSAVVDATLEVQLIETETGASLWNGSGTATRTLGDVGVFGGKNFTFDAADPDRAYGDLVDALVEQATRDFHASWVRP
jgi:hypothetical protein